MAGSAISLQPLTSGPHFNWFFLVELLVCGILTLFFFFYFNRLLATFISYGIRAYTWHYYRVHVDFQALQVSLLGGRVFFKGLRYHGVNETILIQRGYITWNYWLRNVQQLDLKRRKSSPRGTLYQSFATRGGCSDSAGVGEQADANEESGDLRAEAPLPCRIIVTLSGLEWFVYNRTPAYDDILSGFHSASEEPRNSGTTDRASTSGTRTSRQTSQDNLPTRLNSTTSKSTVGGNLSESRSSREVTPGLSARGISVEKEDALEAAWTFLQFLPIQVDCTKGAIVAGNETTPSLLTVQFEKGHGSVDASDAGPLDIYRQLFKFNFLRPVVQLRPNPDFQQEQLSTARAINKISYDEVEPKSKPSYRLRYQHRKHEAWHALRNLLPYLQSSVESFHEKWTNTTSTSRTGLAVTDKWIGLTRYMDETLESQEGWNNVEYARYSTILECSSLSLTYYWDIPGKVPSPLNDSNYSPCQVSDDINGTAPPEWGMEVKLKNGNINYGPWADRERIKLQNVFFPNTFRSSQAAIQLKPGEIRRSTRFKFVLETTDETTLRIPTREESKDWQWKGRAEALRISSKLKKQKPKRQFRGKNSEKTNASPEIRPFGWLTFRLSEDSTVTYDMDMVASDKGFSNLLRLDLKHCKLSTSVNHALLWESSRQVLTCDLSNPLVWNALHTWSFNIISHDMQLFLLRDHIFLVTDLVNDWTANSSSDFYTFVPYKYNIRLSFVDLRFYLNVNDSNIINNPSDVDDNTFIVLKVPNLESNVSIPSDKFRAEKSEFAFDVSTQECSVDLAFPLWHTLRTFLRDKQLGQFLNLSINGTYTLGSGANTMLDTLAIEIEAGEPKCYLYGFLIRYFMKIRENYFGENMHFKTLEEFQGASNAAGEKKTIQTIQMTTNPAKSHSELDVILNLRIRNPCALLPTNIYENHKCLRLEASSLDIDLRFTSYYMDLQVDLTPTKASLQSILANDELSISETQVIINGVSVYGHRLFGLPPTEPTYVCNWDFQVGEIVGECSANFLRSVGAAVRNLDFTMDDEENAIPPLYPITLHDVTFLRATITSLHLSMRVEDAALVLSSGMIVLKLDDWSRSQFSKRVSAIIPDVAVSAIDTKSATRRSHQKILVKSYALIQTTINLFILFRKANLLDDRRSQQDHMKISDGRTHRTPWLLHDTGSGGLNSTFSPPCMTVPPMPEPVSDDLRTSESSSLLTSHRKFASHESLLLPLSTSSPRHVVRGYNTRDSSVGGRRNLDNQERNAIYAPALIPGVLYERNRDPSYAGEMREDATDVQSVHTDPGDFEPSSFWAFPHFTLYKIQPDSSLLPDLPSLPSRNETMTDEDIYAENWAESNTAHADFFCQVQPGLQAYCTSDAISVICSLLEGFQVIDPVDVLDSVQLDVIGDLVKHQKSKRTQPKSISSFSLNIPSASVVFFNELNYLKGVSPSATRDKYHLRCRQFKFTIQNKTEKKERDMIRDSREDITIHSTAEHISVGATSREGSKYQDGSDLSLSLEDIMFWIVNSSKISSHIQVRSIEVLNTTKSTISLAHLVQNSATLLEDTTSLLQAIPSPDERRRYMAWYIINSAAGIPDPLLLTRPAYVLRGLQSHLRLQDSWKIISRLRNIYQNLPLHKQNGLKSNMNGTEMQYPSNARELTFHNFNNWRPWDLAHVEKSHVMRILWDLDSDSDSFPTKPVTISCNLRSISMIIGPGSSHFDSTILDMTTAITFTPAVSKAPWPASESSRNKRSLGIRCQCASSILRIKWGILDYVEKITEAIAKDQDISVNTEIRRSADEKKTENLEIHVFLGVDDGSIILDGINLGLTLQGHGLNGSFVSSPGNGNHSAQKSILLSGQGCSSEISTQSRPLMIGKTVEPRFYGSHSLSGQKKHDWKIATSCRGLTYNLQEDPRELLHIASQVLEDEVLYASSFIQRLDKTMPSRTTNMGLSEPKKIVKDVSESHSYHVALFLDDYQLNFRLLPSLTYSIKGRIARMSGMFDLKNKLDLNFDVKGNRHSFHIVEKEVAQPVSEIDIPPVNGRISGKVSDETTLSFKADLTVERMVLEASALRSLLDVLRRAEVSHYISDCHSSLSDLRVHLKETLTRSEPAPKSPAGSDRPRDITYNVRLTMAGWLVHARAPGLNNKSYSADMNVILGSTQIHLDSSDQHAKFDSPNVQVNVSQIGLELIKNEDSRAQNYGNLGFDISFCASTRQNERDQYGRFYEMTSKGFDIQLYAETASLVIDIAAHLQNRIKSLDLSEDMKRLKHLGRIAKARSRGHPSPLSEVNIADLEESYPLAFLQARYAVEFSNIQICWITNEKNYLKVGLEPEDLVFSIRQVSLSTSGENSAKLRIQDTQLQIAPKSQERRRRSLNSALMPEVVFNVAYSFNNNELRLAFQAAGKAVDISFTTSFILPANIIQKSIASAAERLREANTIWSTSPTQSASQNSLFGKRRLSSLLIDVDFAGAVLTLLGRRFDDQVTRVVAGTSQGKPPSEGKRGKYAQADSTKTASLTSPGVALKVQFGDNGTDDPTLNAELKISPSSNTLAPTVVPLIKQISSSIKEVFGDQNDANMSSSSLLQTQKMLEDRSIDATNPESILGRCKLNIGIRICKQEFSLTCRPIARVAATAQFEDIFVTVNTVQSQEQRRFFAILIACNDLRASVKHDYSNESTASFEMQSMIMSLMNSKHVSTTSGISAILKVSPMRTIINAKQLQDILLFREIWVPSDDDEDPSTPEPIPAPITSESQTLMVQRYQQVASTEVFPWNAVISIEELRIQLDLSQTLGKADFVIKKFWISSKKTSDLEQNLCGGFDVMAIESKGRMSGTVTLDKMRVRTSIQWPNDNSGQTPLIQASVGFGQLQVNASFEYQPFLVADIVAFDFLMYNVRQPSQDRLVSILEGEKVQVFCTTLTASQTLALFQTWQRVVQDKLAAYEASLKETERSSRRKSAMTTSSANSPSLPQTTVEDDSEKWPVTLHTDVVVTLKIVNVGAFPSSFFDNQIFKMEALDAQARFAVSLEDDRLHSSLGLTLGQLRVALSGINRTSTIEMKDHSVAEVAARATGSRGGTILKVPRVVASMQTWQSLGSNEIDYIFKSAFEGKVDVGWNYSRISFIRGMWSAHSRALASRLGKPLPPSAVRITGGPKPGASEDDIASPEEPSNRDDRQPQDRPKQQGEDEKITAVVEVPQSKYIYRAMEPPIIETPQLRDMGEATPPLEWIGLNRERLPNVTHQIIIVSLLEIAKEVSDAYGKILG